MRQRVFTLVNLDLAAESREIVLDQFPVRIGRHEEARVRIEDRWVSRHHCTIDCIDGTLVVCDLGSRHGTWLNGQQVIEARLQVGDRLCVGMTTFQIGSKRRWLGLADCEPAEPERAQNVSSDAIGSNAGFADQTAPTPLGLATAALQPAPDSFILGSQWQIDQPEQPMGAVAPVAE